MLFTLTASALRSCITASRKARSSGSGAGGGGTLPSLLLTDLPRFTRDELNLNGLNLSTNLLVGADASKLEALREAADKASCPCLVLTESEVQAFGTTNDTVGDAAIARLQKVVQAASRMGCSSVGVSITCADNEDEIDFCIERLRRVLSIAERLEVNVMVTPSVGKTVSENITSDPERLTDLIKKVGGFRIGTFPDFEIASKTADPLSHLRKLTPYAQAVTASCVAFTPGKRAGEMVHSAYDLAAYAEMVKSVGYTGTLSIDLRGPQPDPVQAIQLARDVLEHSVGASAVADIEGMIDQIIDEEGEELEDGIDEVDEK